MVQANDLTTISIEEAGILWENGEFSEWVETHGFPITIDDVEFKSWPGVEDALSDAADAAAEQNDA